MAIRINGKHILVTGANRGIGKAFVDELLQRGAATVYATSRDLANLGDVVDPRVVALELDITRPEQIAAVAATIPHLDLLINNAGTATAAAYSAEDSLDVARREMETNYFGTLQLSTALLPQLKQSPDGGIINVSSIAGIANFKALGPYSASKAAVHFLTQGLRAELQNDGIKVLGVYPGPVETRMAAGLDMPKASAASVAVSVLDAWEAGEEDVYPDSFSSTMYQVFAQEPKALERAFSA